jgi:hypothetical protein
MAGPEDDISQAEKRRIIREQATTMFQHALAQAGELSGGRFGAATPAPTVTGATPVPSYPAASAAHQIQLPDEAPLSPYENSAIEISADSIHAEQLGAPVAEAPPPEVAPPSADDVETGAGAPSSSQQDE